MKEIMTKKNVLICIVALFSLLIFETYIIIKQDSRIKWIERNLPVLLKGETVRYFELIDSDNNKINSSTIVLEKNKVLYVYRGNLNTEIFSYILNQLKKLFNIQG